MALDSLGGKYKEWLLEASQLDTTSVASQTLTSKGESDFSEDPSPHGVPPTLPTELATSLMNISNFAICVGGRGGETAADNPLMSDVLGYYVEVRSRHMINQLQRLFQVATDSSAHPSSSQSVSSSPAASSSSKTMGTGIATTVPVSSSASTPTAGVGGEIGEGSMTAIPPGRPYYQRGNHLLIIAIKEFYRLAERETLFAPLVLPPSAQAEAIRRTTKHPADMVRLASEAAASGVIKAAGRGEFLEQLWIFDVVEVFTGLWNQASSMIQELTRSALKAITEAGVHLLRALMDLMQDFSGGAHMGVVSANATVFEETSSLMNCLKRMLEYGRIIEILLTRWSQKDWDGIIYTRVGGREGRSTRHDADTTKVSEETAAEERTPIPSPSFAMALYYQDLLKGLEVSIEQHSHVYKRPLTSVLFQLNNYHYMVRAFRATPGLASLLTRESAQKYEGIVEALLRDYLAHWLHTASLLVEGSTRGAGSLSARERLKAFASEWEDLVKSQAQCAVPDGELRRTLQARVQEAVLPAFTSFYNLNQPTFHSLASRIKLDPPTVEAQIGQLYQA